MTAIAAPATVAPRKMPDPPEYNMRELVSSAWDGHRIVQEAPFDSPNVSALPYDAPDDLRKIKTKDEYLCLLLDTRTDKNKADWGECDMLYYGRQLFGDRFIGDMAETMDYSAEYARQLFHCGRIWRTESERGLDSDAAPRLTLFRECYRRTKDDDQARHWANKAIRNGWSGAEVVRQIRKANEPDKPVLEGRPIINEEFALVDFDGDVDTLGYFVKELGAVSEKAILNFDGKIVKVKVSVVVIHEVQPKEDLSPQLDG